MDQLPGLDAVFIHQDGRRRPMHCSAVPVYDSGDSGEDGRSKVLAE
jgi:hypothetical protein